MAGFDQTTEVQLVASAQAGDKAAFCALVQARLPALLGAAHALGCDRSTAEDLAQETLLEAWRSLPRFDGRCRLGSWLFGILRNRWLKSVSKKSPVTVEAEVVAALVAPRQFNPEAPLDRAEESSQIQRALASLPEAQRQVLELRFFGEASLEEIARLVDCPLGTVKSRLHYGLENLREGLENLRGGLE